jgi:hypothetical protein
MIYGMAGAGKTPIAASLPDARRSTLLIATEPGTLSLKGAGLSYVPCETATEARNLIPWIKQQKNLVNIYFDSISAIADQALGENRRKYKNDARKYSPETVSEICALVLDYCNIPNKNVWMTCKATKSVLENGSVWFEPYAAMPKLAPNLPYYFDNVLFMQRSRDASGIEQVALCCRENVQCNARNRLGRLDLWEPANLSHIIAKIQGS